MDERQGQGLTLIFEEYDAECRRLRLDLAVARATFLFVRSYKIQSLNANHPLISISVKKSIFIQESR